MADNAGTTGQQALMDFAELNVLVRKETYSASDKTRLLELEQRYRFADLNQPKSMLIHLNKVRSQLYSTSKEGVVSVVADGCGDWTGWFELRSDNITWESTYNTGRVVAEVKPDILICVEIEDRPTLMRFNEQVLKAQFQFEYPHVMLVDGNDERGIDVGILSRYPISGVRSHVDERNADGTRIFSRDCPEYVIDLPGNQRLVVIPNHFKSKRGGDSPTVQKRRLAQATTASMIAQQALQISPFVLLGGDLNDTPDSATLQPLFSSGFKDVQSHPSYPIDRPGTYDTGTKANKIDYLFMSPKLYTGLRGCGIERRGSYHPNTWTPFDTVTGKKDEASDHHLVWADFKV